MPPQSTESIHHIPREDKGNALTSHLNSTEDLKERKSKIILINGKHYDITNFNHPGKLKKYISCHNLIITILKA